MMASTPSPRRRSTVTLAMSVEVSPESPWRVLDRRAEHAAGRVDVVDGELDAGELGWSEEGEEPVSGSSEPIFSTPSPSRSTPTGTQVDDRRLGSTRPSTSVVSASSMRLSAPNSSIAVAARERLAVAVEVDAGRRCRRSRGRRRPR